jgi:hypothetical protein
MLLGNTSVLLNVSKYLHSAPFLSDDKHFIRSKSIIITTLIHASLPFFEKENKVVFET